VGLWQFWDPQILKRRNNLGEHGYAVVFHLEKTRRRDTWKKTNKHFKCMFQNLFQTFSQENQKTTITLEWSPPTDILSAIWNSI
jgi:hypothetical protein